MDLLIKENGVDVINALLSEYSDGKMTDYNNDIKPFNFRGFAGHIMSKVEEEVA